MQRTFLAALVLFLAAGTGCRNVNLCKDCGDGHHHGMIGHHNQGYNGDGQYAHAPYGTPGYRKGPHHREYIGPQGPPTAQVAYPYYTVRGPRDFLIDNPPSIGR